MTQPFQPYGQQPPHGAWQDPQAGTQVTAPSHVVPNVPYVRLHGTPLVMLVAALVAAFAALALQGLNFLHSGSATDVSHLQAQVTTLTHQQKQDETTIKGLTATVHTLGSQNGALTKTVDSMTGTVHNLAPFAHGVCPGLFQGSKGAFSASVPCNTG